METTATSLKDRVVRIVETSVASGLHATIDGAARQGNVEDLNLIDDLGMDSVQVLSLLMSLEEEFGIELDEADVDLDKLMCVQALIDFVVRKCATQAATPSA
jgi:acyl carrier protein